MEESAAAEDQRNKNKNKSGSGRVKDSSRTPCSRILPALVIFLSVALLSVVYLGQEMRMPNARPVNPASSEQVAAEQTARSGGEAAIELDFLKTMGQEILIKNPVTVLGRSDVAPDRLRIRIADRSGRVLAETSAADASAGGQAGPFSRAVEYAAPQSPTGYVEVFESAPDGSELHPVSAPVTFDSVPD